MSKTIFETDGLIVSRHVGPGSEGDDRQRWQFTTFSEGLAVLDRRQVRALVLVVMRDAWRVKRNAEDAR